MAGVAHSTPGDDHIVHTPVLAVTQLGLNDVAALALTHGLRVLALVMARCFGVPQVKHLGGAKAVFANQAGMV
jgi:hypothetical protein